MLNLIEKPIHPSRAHFGGEVSGGVEAVLCGRACADQRGFERAERAGHPAALRHVPVSDSGVDRGGGAAFCGRGVEVDESYFGARRVRGRRGRGAGGKTPVIGLLKRGGKVFTEIVENCSKQELMPIIRGQVLSESTVYTDGWKSCDGLVLGGYKHHRIHHQQNQFARGRNHVNGIESFWSFTKLRLAKLRGIRPNSFILHLKESEWRFNHRHDCLYSLLLKNLRLFPL